MPVIEGNYSAASGRFAIVAARFNEFVVDPLIDGAIDGLIRHGIRHESIDTIRVPGSFEIPLIAKQAAESGKYVAVICLGAVIRGETTHYDHVAGAVASGIAQVSLATNIPVIFGVLTCETVEQAINRAGAKSGNKGFEASLTAIEMVHLLKLISK